MERENINRCLGGLRMEDQGERNPQTFLVNNRCAFKRVLNTDSGIKAAACLDFRKQKMVKYICS